MTSPLRLPTLLLPVLIGCFPSPHRNPDKGGSAGGADDTAADSADPCADGPKDWYEDGDGDHFGAAGSSPVSACEVPGGFVAEATDCDDTDGTIFPGAEEVCDGVDSDCDPGTDDFGVTAWTDDDGDGYGTIETISCFFAPGYAENGGDCDDTAEEIHPEATEICGNGVDEDCHTGCRVTGEIELVGGYGYAGYTELGNTVFPMGDFDGDTFSDVAISDMDWDCTGTVILLMQGSDPWITFPIAEGVEPCGGAGIPTGLSTYHHVLALADDATDTLSVYDIGERDTIPEPWVISSGETDNPFFGLGTVQIGDLDGDGNPELAVPSRLEDGRHDQDGTVYILSGNDLGPLCADTELVDNGARFIGSSDSAAFGSSVTSADLDGDGYDELVVGAPGDGSRSYGAAYIFSPAGSIVFSEAENAAAILVASFDDEAKRFGAAVSAGSFGTDGEGAVAVGAPESDRTGRVFLFPQSALSGTLESDDATMVFEATDGVPGFGSALGAADLDGDELDELYISNSDRNSSHTEARRVVAFYGPDYSDSLIITAQKEEDGRFADCIVRVPMENGDNRDDLTFCNPGRDYIVVEAAAED